MCKPLFAIKDLFEGKIDHLPSYEKKALSLGWDLFLRPAPFRIIQALNAFGAQTGFYQQIKRMGSNKSPNLKMETFSALRRDAREQRALRKLKNKTTTHIKIDRRVYKKSNRGNKAFQQKT